MENSSLQSSNGRSTKERKNNLTPFEFLCAAKEQINPAILLAEELMRKDIAEILDFETARRSCRQKTAAVWSRSMQRQQQRSFDWLPAEEMCVRRRIEGDPEP